MQNWADEIRRGDRTALSKALTLVESTLAEDRLKARDLLGKLRNTGSKSSLRLGVTGPPGVGKSSLIERISPFFIDQGNKVAVLSIDPSSTKTGGSIMGDKARMQLLANEPRAFIRPSNNANVLGGLNRNTYSSIQLMEAAGYEIVIIETVGVGQAELDIANICDILVVLIQPGSGDDLQALKKGIMEWSDVFVIHKNDGLLKKAAETSFAEISSILNHKGNNNQVKAFKTSIEDKDSIRVLYEHIVKLFNILIQENKLFKERKLKMGRYFDEQWLGFLATELNSSSEFKNVFEQLRNQIIQGELEPELAFEKLINFIFALPLKK